MAIQKLVATALGALIYVIFNSARADVASIQPTGASASRHFEAIILIGGQEAGVYREDTVYGAADVQDMVEQKIAVSRLGSSVEILSKEVSFQDSDGHLVRGHYEATSSKSTVTTDLVVEPHAIALQIHSGGRSYDRKLPLTGSLLGPEGVRLMLAKASSLSQALHYQTFTSALNDVMSVSLQPLSRETLMIEGVDTQTRKWEMRASGIPTPWTLWVDDRGRTVRMLQDSPFGPIETERRYAVRSAQPAGATLPEDSYENTLAVANIRLPHPRELKSVTVEITRKKRNAGTDWPNLASETQSVLSKTPDRLVLLISQPQFPPLPTSATFAADEYLRPNALLQSDDPEVLRTAMRISNGEPDPWKLAMALQKWTSENMHFDTGIAIVPASEVVRDRHGTCMGYSILLASLARAAKIPSRLKMGYVYDGGIWGGHAWVEVWIRGRWLAIDAAEYQPGIADAARIAVITATGDSGTIEGVGDLGSLYSKVNIRVLNYRLHDTVAVAPQQKDHVVRGDEYDNPWLGVRVHKQADAEFADLDAHWPSPAVVTVKKHGSTASLLYGRSVKDMAPSALEATLAQTLKFEDAPTFIQWDAAPAIRVRSGDKEEVLAVAGDAYWAIISAGPDSHALLNQLLRSTSIADLSEKPFQRAPR
jgi:transglutaminase-like putative cysteine protease